MPTSPEAKGMLAGDRKRPIGSDSLLTACFPAAAVAFPRTLTPVTTSSAKTLGADCDTGKLEAVVIRPKVVNSHAEKREEGCVPLQTSLTKPKSSDVGVGAVDVGDWTEPPALDGSRQLVGGVSTTRQSFCDRDEAFRPTPRKAAEISREADGSFCGATWLGQEQRGSPDKLFV
jgi:hypothetical protein